MQRLNGSIIIILLVLTVLAGSYVGCSRDSGDDPPFYTERVVKVNFVMPEEDWQYIQENALAEQYVKADLWFDGELIPDIAVRTKGQSSLMFMPETGSSKFGLKADLNFFNSQRNLYGVKKLCFNNGFADPTLIREILSYEIYEQMDIPTPRASFVELWVNDTHLGLYTMAEAIDKTFISNNFADNSGNLYKPMSPAGYLSWTKEDYEEQLAEKAVKETDDIKDEMNVNMGGGNLADILRALETREAAAEANSLPSSGLSSRRAESSDFLGQMSLKTNENRPDHSLLFRMLDILNNEPDETFPTEIEKVMDVDEALRFLAVSTLIVHLDNYLGMGNNYYLYDNHGKFVILPWDLNMTFGTFRYGLDREKLINYYIDEPSGGPMAERPLINRLLSHQPYFDTYHGYLEELLDGPFAVDRMNSRIDELAALVRPYVQIDDQKFFSTADFEKCLEEDVAPQRRSQIQIGLKSFVRERSASVINQLAGISPSGSGEGKGNGGRFGF